MIKLSIICMRKNVYPIWVEVNRYYFYWIQYKISNCIINKSKMLLKNIYLHTHTQSGRQKKRILINGDMIV